MNYYYQVYLTITILSLSVSAKFRYEHFKAFSYRDDNDGLRKPWFVEDHLDTYATSASDLIPRYSDLRQTVEVPSDRLLPPAGQPSFDNSPEILFTESTKRIPKEDKYVKKVISPFYSLNNKNGKLKGIVSKSIPADCKVIRTKTSKDVTSKSEKDVVTCYRCKDPKSGSMYEHCSYSSKPQASAKIEHFLPAPSGFRYRRSHVDNSQVRSLGTSLKFLEVDDHGKPKDPYRFSDEFFTDATQEVPAAYKKETESCERIIKDSMVCMVCKDAKTNGKYEQCSYVTQPNEKAYAYSKSSSFGKTDPKKIQHSRESPERYESYVASRPSQSESQDHELSYPGHNEHYRQDKSDDRSREDSNDESASANDCRKVEKDGQTCTVCTDAKKGGETEKCTYTYEPKNRSYSYTKSGSFGEPEDKGSTKSADRSRQPYGSSYPKNSRYYEGATPEEQSDDEKEASATSADCKKVEKNGETCMVCKDPKTGGNYERCSYAFEPNDKVYKFSKSKRFGRPQSSKSSENPSYEGKGTEGASSEPHEASEHTSDYSYPEDSSYYQPSEEGSSRSAYTGSPSSSYYDTGSSSYHDSSKPYEYETSPSADYKSISEKAAENIDASNCKEVQRDSMTCTVCKDPKTGGNSEQCSYSFQPKDKVFSYTKARSFGSPTNTKEDASNEPSEKSAESYEGPYNDNHSYGYVSESKPHVAIDHPRSSEFKASTKNADEPSEETTMNPDKVEKGFFDTSKKKEEIEHFLQEFQKEDRSKCKKVMRDKMTCYQCTDEKGFQKEECVFIAAQQPSKSKDRLAYRELKQYQLPEALIQTPSATESRKQKPKRRRAESPPLEPTAAASEDSYSHEKPAENEQQDESQEKAEPTENEEREDREEDGKEAEPYEYTLETRSRYDKTLGLTLPEYMLTPSEHELAFDEAVASGYKH